MLSYHAPSKISMLLMQRRLKGVGKSRVSDTREHHPMVQQSAQNRSIVIFFGRGTSLNLRMALSTWAKKAQVSTHPSEDIPEVLVSMEIGGASNRDTKARLSKTQEDYIVLKKNHVGAGYLTVLCKQLRKIRQFLRKD